MIDPRTPILVGCGQITDTTGKPSSERSNVAFCAEAARLALGDASASIGPEALARKIDAVAVLEFAPFPPLLIAMIASHSRVTVVTETGDYSS
jgi:acetyl-CoA C-acetyltransferase